MELILDTYGLLVNQRNKCFSLHKGKEQRLISPKRVSSICVSRNCRITSSALILAASNDIPVYFLDTAGKVQALLLGGSGGRYQNIKRHQVYFSQSLHATGLIISLFELKTSGQLDNLKYLLHRKKGKAKSIEHTIQKIKERLSGFSQYKESLLNQAGAGIMGTEGIISKYYWSCLATSLYSSYRFHGRSRRPAKDVFNAALNYLYGVLYTKTEVAILAGGLDPYIGLLHADVPGKPVLTFDFIEPFRPWVDRFLVEKCQSKQLTDLMFDQDSGGFMLNRKGKEFLIPEFLAYLNAKCFFNEKLRTRLNHMYAFIREQAVLIEKFRTDE